MKNVATKMLHVTVLSALFSFLSPVCAAPGEAKFIAQFVPAHMETGAQYEVMLQFKNTGNATWSQGNGYQLHTTNNDETWQVNAVPLTDTGGIAPGNVTTLKFTITAPATPGSYPFQWQIRRHNKPVAGDLSPALQINVVPAQDKRQAEFVMQTLPGLITEGPAFSIMKIGQVFPVKIVYKNTGTVTWQASNLNLVSQMPEKNLTWMLDSVAAASDRSIAPGEFVTYEFTANAPTSPGIYDFQWRLYDKTVGGFGAPTEPVKITVK